MYPNLRAEIARKGLTVAEVAKIINKSVNATGYKLSGKREFCLSECKALSRALGVPIDVLFDYGTELSGERSGV